MQKDLLDWILRHIKQKDVFFKKIEEIEELEDRAIIKYKTKTDLVMAFSELDQDSLSKITSADTQDSVSSWALSCVRPHSW